MSTNLCAKIYAYKEYLIIECIAKKSEKNKCHFSIDNPDCIGQVILDIKKNLGVSKEAIDLMKNIKCGQDAIGDFDVFKSNDGKMNCGWFGRANQILNSKFIVGSKHYITPTINDVVIIENDAPIKAIEAIETEETEEN